MCRISRSVTCQQSFMCRLTAFRGRMLPFWSTTGTWLAGEWMAGRWQKAKEGRWNGGFAPYGYALKDGELIIEENEADAIRLIFDKYTNGNMGVNSVAKWMNDNGYKK